MFKNIEWYKPDIDRTIRDQQKSHEIAMKKLASGSVTFRALPPSDSEPFLSFNLLDYKYDTDLEKYAEDWLSVLETSMFKRRELDDNFIPNISPMLGIGDYSAFVAGDIYFSKDTSWSKPVLNELKEWRELPAIGTSVWYKRFMHICELLLNKSKGSGIPFMRGFFSPLDLAAALRGEAIYYDFFDYENELHCFLDYCADCTIHLAKNIKTLTGQYLAESDYGMFFQDGINMSEDIACMISADMYREFCAPHTQKVIDSFGKGYMHCHSRAMYLVKEICQLKNVATLWLATDPNQPKPINYIEELVDDANRVCLNIDCDSFEEIEKNSEALKKGNFSVCLPVKSLEDARIFTQKANSLFEV